MIPQYQINDHKLKKYVEILEQTIKDSSKGLPKGYYKIKGLEERAEVLEGKLFDSLLKRQSFYKIYK